MIRNTDGSEHREQVVRYHPPKILEDRIFGMTSPFRFLVRKAHDVFDFETIGNQTLLRRAFRFTLRSPIALPIAWALLPVFRRALRRHHANLAQELAAKG